MGAVVLLLIVIMASTICVRAGAIALELTGMPLESARFQALSAFTNTGFTTREAEEIVRVPARRQIIKVLIVLGHAGTVSVIATFASSLLQRNFLNTALNVGVISVALYLLYRIMSSRGPTRRLGDALRRWLITRYGLRAPSLEEMIRVTEGMGVMRVRIRPQSPLAGRPLSDLGLKARKIQILSIQRGREIVTVPGGADVIEVGDDLICYGSEQEASNLFAAGDEEDPATGRPAGEPASQSWAEATRSRDRS